MLKRTNLKRCIALLLIGLGAILIFLAPETSAGLALLVVGVALELIGIALSHRQSP